MNQRDGKAPFSRRDSLSADMQRVNRCSGEEFEQNKTKSFFDEFLKKEDLSSLLRYLPFQLCFLFDLCSLQSQHAQLQPKSTRKTLGRASVRHIDWLIPNFLPSPPRCHHSIGKDSCQPSDHPCRRCAHVFSPPVFHFPQARIVNHHLAREACVTSDLLMYPHASSCVGPTAESSAGHSINLLQCCKLQWQQILGQPRKRFSSQVKDWPC
jgi:hypothetical protein